MSRSSSATAPGSDVLAHGELGESLEKDVPVATLLSESLAHTAILAFFVFLFMIPLSLGLGLMAGVNEGSLLDRAISFPLRPHDLDAADRNRGAPYRPSGIGTSVGAGEVRDARGLLVPRARPAASDAPHL